jgi:hypothetical protein
MKREVCRSNCNELDKSRENLQNTMLIKQSTLFVLSLCREEFSKTINPGN